MGSGFHRFALGLALVAIAAAQSQAQHQDPAYAPLAKAYAELHEKKYDEAIVYFQKAVALAPNRPDIRKDLAYTLLKVGQTEAARDQFAEAMRLSPQDDQAALEYAFLCYETKQPITARRIFERLGKAGNATAKETFENIDRPLREGIARWTKALELEPADFSAHEELARLAEQRDDLALAAEHYERAWRLRPDRRDLLLDLGRVWKEMHRDDDANAALIAAWRGASPRVSEEARELLPSRYPYLSEFEHALALDPGNTQLQRDVAYQKGNPLPPDHPKALVPRSQNSPPATPSEDAKTLGERSFAKGYLNDALRYLQVAHENDPVDFDVMLKLGWTYNMLKDDVAAIRWFDLARRSPDPEIASEASQAYRSLAPSLERFRTTVWAYPILSTRWHDLFTYAQVKTEVRLARMPLRPYASLRFIGDARGAINAGFGPQYLSERSAIAAAGLATVPWHGLTSWFEAGEAFLYSETLTQRRRTMPDYRGGLSYSRGLGHLLAGGSHGLFAETANDGLFVSRFSDDSLLYSQNRAGYTFRSAEGFGGLHGQALWNVNITADAKGLYWANYVESGPGVRFRFESLLASPLISVSFLRGAYTINNGNPRRPNYNEVRVGIWYAFTR